MNFSLCTADDMTHAKIVAAALAAATVVVRIGIAGRGSSHAGESRMALAVPVSVAFTDVLIPGVAQELRRNRP